MSVPQARDTLVLGNGTVLAGDAVLPPTDGEYTAYDPQTHLIYLSDGSDTILEVDPSRFNVVGGFNVSGAAGNLVIDAASGWLLVDSNQDVLAVWATNGTLAASIAVPDAWSGMDGTIVLDPVENTLWVTNPFSSNVSVVSLASASLLTQRRVGEGFNDILSGVYDPVNGDVYLSYYEDGTVEVFNASTLVRLPDVNLSAFCCFAWGLGVDPVSGNVYVTDGLATFWSDYVEISGTNNSVAGSVGVGVYPSNSVYDPTTGMMYLVDAYRSRLFVIDPSNLTVLARIPITQDAPLLAGQDYPTDLPDLGEVVVALQYREHARRNLDLERLPALDAPLP